MVKVVCLFSRLKVKNSWKLVIRSYRTIGGKGYATEAARKLKEWAFKNTSRNQLISIIYTANAASARVAQKNGMKLWKHVPDYQGLSVDVYRITRDEWSTT